jgi:hypothetical protein
MEYFEDLETEEEYEGNVIKLSEFLRRGRH